MKSEKARNRQKELASDHITKDLQTYFIIAGYTGTGKSTIARTSNELETRLFGEHFYHHFRDTSRSHSHAENDNYDEAIKTSTNFQGKHLHDPKKEEHPQKILLIQLEPKHVAYKLGHKAASKNAQKKIKELTDTPTLHKKRPPRHAIC